KTISKYLDGEYTVKASVGHIRDLPKSNKKAIDIPAGFIPHYEISPGKEKVVAEIRDLANKASEVILATDPDREGEAIAWHIAEATGLKDAKRVVFHEITKEAVVEAMKHPRRIDENLRMAQEARRVLDRLVGYDLSGLIWKKVRYGLSAGRVQSPALRIIMEREREIRAFISHAFWVITADTDKLLLTCSEEPTDFREVEKILKKGKEGSWEVREVEESKVKRSPRAPFITSTLQQAASSRLGFSPSRTMSVAQRLYEAGHITYMRTDSTNLSQIALAEISKIVEKKYGKDYLEFRTYAKKSKNAQEAHEAIRPSHIAIESAGLNEEQKILYKLIWERTVASQMADAELLRTKITANIKDGGIPDFQANGSRLLFPGWLTADPEARGEDVELPKIVKGDALNLKEIKSEEKATQPPGRYSEAGLIKELEKRGIGRPSTYASIIRTIEERGYVEKENKALKPTDTGDVVSTFLETNFMHYINDSFTAEMEDSLDDIANGDKEYLATLKKFYIPFQKEIKILEKEAKITNLGVADAKFKCPKCAGDMIIKLGRNGKFISCSRYPDCDGALMLDGTEIKKDEPIGIDPATNLPIFVLVGKYGPYVQLGERAVKPKGRRKKGDPIVAKPRMASIPKGMDLSNISMENALKYLSLPKILGVYPSTGKNITANIGRFGPYIVHDTDFRSLKAKDGHDPYTITLEKAIEILNTPKVVRKGKFAKKVQNKI
ncbi:MAG: type I DNA topoisomerase, partial [Candidatus Taylorbacteria bacterium]|nr:type I DNA topoisomerase [Candidatus Taylorbacteria bacterium]